ncbi:MAG TPA: hypothetical protein VFD92_09025 [Candidatus Binatia bacterium]|nr:hypothetical protein [Candidatus Binatia bacterium]
MPGDVPPAAALPPPSPAPREPNGALDPRLLASLRHEPARREASPEPRAADALAKALDGAAIAAERADSSAGAPREVLGETTSAGCIAIAGELERLAEAARALAREPDSTERRLDLIGAAEDLAASVRGLARAVAGLRRAARSVQGSPLPPDAAIARWCAEVDRRAAALRDAINAEHGHPAASDQDGHVAADLFCGASAAELAVSVSGPRAIAAARRAAGAGGNAAALADRAIRSLVEWTAVASAAPGRD